MRWRGPERVMRAVARADLPRPVRLRAPEIYGAVTLGALIVALITVLWVL